MICEDDYRYDYAYLCIALTLTVAKHLNVACDIINLNKVETIFDTFVLKENHFKFNGEKLYITSNGYRNADGSERYLVRVASVWDIIGATVFRLYSFVGSEIGNITWQWHPANGFDISQTTLDHFAKYASEFIKWLQIID